MQSPYIENFLNSENLRVDQSWVRDEMQHISPYFSCARLQSTDDRLNKRYARMTWLLLTHNI